MLKRLVLALVVALAALHAHDASAASQCDERARDAERFIVVRDLVGSATGTLTNGRCVVTLTLDVPR